MAGGIAQEVISRLESPGYGRLTLSTALRLASAFDVGLTMRFVPLSDVLDRAIQSTQNEMVIPNSKHDARLDDAAKGLSSPISFDATVLNIDLAVTLDPPAIETPETTTSIVELYADSGDVFAVGTADDDTGGGADG
jgi:hypothetical protein